MANATIRPDEADHFGRLAQDWWDPRGASAMLHRLNPVRLAFLRDALDVTMTDHKLYTSFTVKGLKRETTCTGAFTKIWCQRPVMGD